MGPPSAWLLCPLCRSARWSSCPGTCGNSLRSGPSSKQVGHPLSVQGQAAPHRHQGGIPPLASAGLSVPTTLACSVTVLIARQETASFWFQCCTAVQLTRRAALWCCARRQAGAPRIAAWRNKQKRKKQNACSSTASPHQSQPWPACRVPLPLQRDRFAQVGSRPPSQHCQCGVGGSPTLLVAGSLPFQFFLPVSPFCRLCCRLSSPACTPLTCLAC